MTKILTTRIRNIKETFNDTLMGIPLRYIAYYSHAHDSS